VKQKIMQINRQSYEEFFLLYADGELNESEKKAVEEFINVNPDLAGELSLIRETVMQPDDSIIFENKELLFKDEEEERKVIYMRWYRIAAAAVILIAFSVIGWVFLGEKNLQKEPLAVVKTPEVKKPEISDVVPPTEKKSIEENDLRKTANVSKEKSSVPTITASDKREKIKQENRITNQNIQPNTKEIINEPDVVKNKPSEKLPEGIAFTQDVVKTDAAIETIDVPIEPRAMENKEEQTGNDAYYAQSFRQESDNDLIYFANTSLTKKTKLRGVLRKATRYLDRVTSLQ